MSFENGLHLNLDYKIAEIYRKFVRSELKIYESLDDYIGDYTIQSNVQLANFRKIFWYVFHLYVLIILTFALNQIYKYRREFGKLFEKMIRKLQRT